MKSSTLYLMLFVFCLAVVARVQAADNLMPRAVVQNRDVVVPAGTLMTCTLDEPKFSSATVSVGDPFLCHPRSMQQFGQIVFPRGTYIVGHLEADKAPGHFVGKGYLKLAFDRLGLPEGDVPLTAKMIAVGGYNVDRQGKIIGHGHATRDAVEWMLPPLWPWKVLSLPARGPRPTLKGETQITLRVMDDLIVPAPVRESNVFPAMPGRLPATQGWHRFGEKPSGFQSPGFESAPQLQELITTRYKTLPMVESPAQVQIEPQTQTVMADLTSATAPAPASIPAVAVAVKAPVAPMPANELATPVQRSVWAPGVTLFAMADGTILPVSRYWRDQEKLCYISDQNKGTVSLHEVDWSTTLKLNSARNVRVILHNAPTLN